MKTYKLKNMLELRCFLNGSLRDIRNKKKYLSVNPQWRNGFEAALQMVAGRIPRKPNAGIKQTYPRGGWTAW